MIDIKAIDGMAVVQLADYATMRAFARTRPVGSDSSASTILSLFDKTAPAPRELTTFDLGYLSAIYKTQGNLPASAKIGAIPEKSKSSWPRHHPKTRRGPDTLRKLSTEPPSVPI